MVASDVRALAQRLGTAAREIKGLITANVEQVGEGTRVVHRAGKAIDEVVGLASRA